MRDLHNNFRELNKHASKFKLLQIMLKTKEFYFLILFIPFIGLAQDADILIKDSQFTDDQLPEHKGWGHSSWQQCTQVAEKARVKQLILYHHSPQNNDEAIRKIEADAQTVFPNTISARQGLEIKLPA